MSLLELRGVSKVYGQGAAQVQALRGVDLSVEAGSMVAVMGPSGSGKSTLLTIAGSLEEPTDGEVLIGGTALSGMSRNDLARLRRRCVGSVFQDFNQLPGLTAWRPGRPAPPAGGRSKSLAWPAAPPTFPTSCPVASASGWRSPGRWSASAGCCWPTSPRGRSTRPTAKP